MKTELSVDQSQHLIELGVDAKLASGHTQGVQKHCGGNLYQIISRGKPIFRLTDILNILPKEIKSDDTIMGDGFISELQINWDCNQKVWNSAYLALPHPVGVGKAPELIDALYQLLIWCINNGHYNPKNEEK